MVDRYYDYGCCCYFIFSALLPIILGLNQLCSISGLADKLLRTNLCNNVKTFSGANSVLGNSNET